MWGTVFFFLLLEFSLFVFHFLCGFLWAFKKSLGVKHDRLNVKRRIALVYDLPHFSHAMSIWIPAYIRKYLNIKSNNLESDCAGWIMRENLIRDPKNILAFLTECFHKTFFYWKGITQKVIIGKKKKKKGNQNLQPDFTPWFLTYFCKEKCISYKKIKFLKIVLIFSLVTFPRCLRFHIKEKTYSLGVPLLLFICHK